MKAKLLALAAFAPLPAFAVQDYSSISTALTAEIAAAMPVVLAVFAIVAGVGLGLRLIKRATHG